MEKHDQPGLDWLNEKSKKKTREDDNGELHKTTSYDP